MAESPSGYFPDYLLAWSPPKYRRGYRTEIKRARTGRQVRREVGLPQRYWSADIFPLPEDDRYVVENFLHTKKGTYGAFYFFSSAPEKISSFSAGTVTAATSIVVPWKGPWWLLSDGRTPTYEASTIISITVGGTPAVSPTSTPNIGSGGEDRYNWTGSMTGEVIVTARHVRLRLVAHNATDDININFMGGVADAQALFPIAIEELI